MSFSEKNVSICGDADPLPAYKVQKREDNKKTRKDSLRKKPLPLSYASTVKPASYSGKQVIIPNHTLTRKPSHCIAMGDSSNPKVNFPNHIEGVSMFGPDKVLLVKVTDNRNDVESMKGKSLVKFQEKPFSFGSFGNKLVKLTSSRIMEEKNINDTRLGKREADFVLERSSYQQSGVCVNYEPIKLKTQSKASHESGSIINKTLHSNIINYRDIPNKPITNNSSEKSFPYDRCLADTGTNSIKINTINILSKRKCSNEGSQKLKYTLPGLNSMAFSGNGSMEDTQQIFSNSTRKAFNVQNTLSESSNVYGGCLKQSKDETYQVKCLEDGCCSIKKIQERPEVFQSNDKKMIPKVYKLSTGKQHNKQMELQKLRDSNSSKGFFSSSNDNFESLLGNLHHSHGTKETIPNLDNVEYLFPSPDVDKSTYQNYTSDTANECVPQNVLKPPEKSSAELSNSFHLAGQSDLNVKNSERLPDFTECFSTSGKINSVRTAPASFPDDYFTQQKSYSPSNSLNTSNHDNESSLRGLEDLMLQDLPEHIEVNKDDKFTDLNFLDQTEVSEEFCVTSDTANLINGSTNYVTDSISSAISCSEAWHLETGIIKPAQNVCDKSVFGNGILSSQENSSDVTVASQVSTSNVVWTLQTPQPSVASNFKSLTNPREMVADEMKSSNGKGNYCIETCMDDLLKNCIDENVNVDTNHCSLMDKFQKVDDSFSTSILGFDKESKASMELNKNMWSENLLKSDNEVHSGCADNNYTSEVLAVTKFSSESLSTGYSEVPTLSDWTSDINSDIDNVPLLLAKGSNLVTSADAENIIIKNNLQPTHTKLKELNPNISSNESSDKLEVVPLTQVGSLSEPYNSIDAYNPNDINNLLDSFFKETEQHGVDTDGSKNSCTYPLIDELNFSAKNMGVDDKSLMDDIFKDIDNDNFTSSAEKDDIEILYDQPVAKRKNEAASSGTVTSLPQSMSGTRPKSVSGINSSDKTKTKLQSKRIPRNVSFKTRPASRPIKCVVRGQVVENKLQKQPRPLRFVLDKDRRLQNQDGSTSWPRREEFNPEKFNLPRNKNASNKMRQIESSIAVGSQIKPMPNILPATSVSTGDIATTVNKIMVPYNMAEASKFVLPVGRTGLSISIPKTAPTSIASFMPAPETKCYIPSLTKQTKKNFSEAQVVAITTNVKSQTPALVSNLPEQRNAVILSQDARKIIIPTTVITQPMYHVPIPQTSTIESLYVMVPACSGAQIVSGSGTPSLVPNILPWNTSAPLCSANSVIPAQAGSFTGKRPIAKYCLKSYVHPIASKGNTVKSAAFLSTKAPVAFEGKTSETVKILINTKANSIDNVDTSVKLQEEGVSTDEIISDQNLKSDYVQKLRHKILKKKPYPDYIHKKFSKLLRDELRLHLPNFPESILMLLNLPPQAVERGYFSLRDLNALRTQALRLRLGIIFRDHVKVCKVQNCATCFEFLQQKESFSLAEKEKSASSKLRVRSRSNTGRGRSRGRGRKRRGGRIAFEEREDDPSYEPPQSFFATSKRKFEDNQNKAVKISRSYNSSQNSFKPGVSSDLVNESKAMDNLLCCVMKMKRSNSESDIHTLTEIPVSSIKDDRPRSFDDSYLMLYHTIKDSCRCQSLFWSGNVKRSNDNKKSKLKQIIQDDCETKIVTKLESFQHMLKAAAYDLLLKKQLERDFVPFFKNEGSEQNEKPSFGVCPKPLYLDLLSLEIGPFNIAGKYNIRHPKLHVMYTARKIVYEFVLWLCHARETEVQTEALLSTDSPMHLLITIDVPFTTLRALNITANKVMLVVNTVPLVQVMGRRGVSCFVLSEKDVLSPKQHNCVSHMKAALTIYPLHKLLLDQGKGQLLHRGLCGFSTWFTRMLAQSFPIQDDHTPSWCLASHLTDSNIVSEVSATGQEGCSNNEKQMAGANTHQLGPFRDTAIQQGTQPLLQLGNTQECSSWKLNHEASTVDKNCDEPCIESASAETRTSGEGCGKVLDDESSAESFSMSNNNGTFSMTATNYNDSLNNDMMQVVENNVNINNVSSGPSGCDYLVSTVKAALESQEMLPPVSFNPGLQFPLASYEEKGCNCEETCRVMECPCARAGALCRTRHNCSCKECDNPLNVLHVLGLNIHTARVDECLMQSLYSYNLTGLCSLLASPITLPCCGATSELLHIIPGTVLCNCCGMAVCYSWCSHHIHLQILCPRNHCLVCCACKPALHTHCQKCHKCTPSNQGMCTQCGIHKLF
ncbi:uncharacterized protein [Procambarus clarkii]|uniref:uncharacterized protein n=1 Tax=Procambarus clarkii TaxID=6728 RepID=UPI003743E75B